MTRCRRHPGPCGPGAPPARPGWRIIDCACSGCTATLLPWPGGARPFGLPHVRVGPEPPTPPPEGNDRGIATLLLQPSTAGPVVTSRRGTRTLARVRGGSLIDVDGGTAPLPAPDASGDPRSGHGLTRGRRSPPPGAGYAVTADRCPDERRATATHQTGTCAARRHDTPLATDATPSPGRPRQWPGPVGRRPATHRTSLIRDRTRDLYPAAE